MGESNISLSEPVHFWIISKYSKVTYCGLVGFQMALKPWDLKKEKQSQIINIYFSCGFQTFIPVSHIFFFSTHTSGE